MNENQSGTTESSACTSLIRRNGPTVLLIGFIGLLLFAFAWQSHLFGLGRQTETVIVPSASRSGAGTGAFTGPVGGEQNDADIADETAGVKSSTRPDRELEIVTLLPFGAIPAIFNPSFVSAAEAQEGGSGKRYSPDEKILGIKIDGDIRAYSVPMLSRHEVVNDTVGGVPVAVTW